MRAYWLTLLLLLFLAPAAAQKEPSPATLAEAFCQCMQGPHELSPRGKAEECLQQVATRHQEYLREEWDLDARKRAHRMRLAEALVDPLALNCPYLQTLNVRAETELRWSDRRAAPPATNQYVSPKSPPADERTRISGEVPAQWRATGELLERFPSKTLRLRLENGREISLEVPLSLRREGRLAVGQEVRITYRREWRKEPQGQVVNVLTGVAVSGGSRP
ncbi:MAG: hypothetical protein AAFZ52_18595 [Bacteroidota bacterium]